MYMLNSPNYDEEKMQEAIMILYTDRKNHFQEIWESLVNKKMQKIMPNWKEFVLNFCIDVEDSFRKWSGQNPILVGSPQKSLTLLRKLGNGKTTMNQLAHLLNISYNLSVEFKEIYKRLK